MEEFKNDSEIESEIIIMVAVSTASEASTPTVALTWMSSSIETSRA